MNFFVFNSFLSIGDDIGFVALLSHFQKNIFFGYHYTALFFFNRNKKKKNELIRIFRKN